MGLLILVLILLACIFVGWLIIRDKDQLEDTPTETPVVVAPVVIPTVDPAAK